MTKLPSLQTRYERAVEDRNRAEALNRELVEALKIVHGMVGHPDNIAIIEVALAKTGVK